MSEPTEEPQEPKEEGAPEWVVTFGDLMSLLLCFFVLLLSFSEMDRQKYKIVAGSLAQAFGVQRQEKVQDNPMGAKMIAMAFEQDLTPQHEKDEFVATQPEKSLGEDDLEDLGETLKANLQKHLEGLEEKVEIEVNGNQTIIRLTGETTFDSGKADIRPQLVPLLEEIGNRLKEAEGDLIIAGHTDNVPVSGKPFKNNLQLSIARAAEVAEFMIGRVGISPQRVSTMGFGQYRPIDTNDTPAGRERNRRVEIVLTALPPAPEEGETPSQRFGGPGLPTSSVSPPKALGGPTVAQTAAPFEPTAAEPSATASDDPGPDSILPALSPPIVPALLDPVPPPPPKVPGKAMIGSSGSGKTSG